MGRLLAQLAVEVGPMCMLRLFCRIMQSAAGSYWRKAKAKRKSALSFRFNYICEISRKHEICFRCFKPPENGVSFVPVAKCQ